MARATFVKKARKDVAGTEIKKGDSYYWWKFRHSGKYYSKTMPRPSQLTQSEFLSTIYALEEGLNDDAELMRDGRMDAEGFADSIENVASEVENLGSETSDKISNMESAFPNGNPTIELLQERVDKCEEIEQALQDLASEIRESEEDSDDIAARIDDIDWSVE